MNDIRIGTLVKGQQDDVAGYIREILPYGFESFSITFWQTTEGIDFVKLADEVNAVLGTDAIVSSLGILATRWKPVRKISRPCVGGSSASIPPICLVVILLLALSVGCAVCRFMNRFHASRKFGRR